jgi:DNA-binding NtrC family response regulator
LKRHLGRISSAAVELGISRPTLYELMEKLGINRHATNSSISPYPLTPKPTN